MKSLNFEINEKIIITLKSNNEQSLNNLFKNLDIKSDKNLLINKNFNSFIYIYPLNRKETFWKDVMSGFWFWE